MKAMSATSMVIGIFSLVLYLGSVSCEALERDHFAADAESVTPLLNGMLVPNIKLTTIDGAPVSLRAFTMQKPTIILFYRGGWCPYCSRQLASLKDIEGELVELGYQILAISPESPERLQGQKLETEFAVTLLSDHKLNAIRSFGVGYYMDEATVSRYQSNGILLTSDSTGTPVLPAPALFFVNTQGQILFNYVNPNFKVRPSADLVLQVAKVLAAE
jgi:peroxiredoxin